MSPKLRKYLVLAHLWIAGLMAPAFVLHAVSGGLYLMDIKGNAVKTEITVPAGQGLDFKSATLESDTRAVLTAMGQSTKFNYIRDRGNVIQLRPTSRDYVEFQQTPEGLKAYKVEPDLVASMMELHKGHGPSLFKLYQKLVALLLIGVVFGGILVGLLAKAYRRPTTIAVIGGIVVFLFLALFA